MESVMEWFLLGVRLGIPYPKLKEIEQDHPRDTSRCKNELLQYWMKNDHCDASLERDVRGMHALSLKRIKGRVIYIKVTSIIS